MRPSKRTEILEAATRVVQAEGVTALTYESVAVEAGLTKGGLLYHFPSRDALLLALHQHVAGQWERAMEEWAGSPADQLDDDARFAAYAQLSQNPNRAELLLMLEASQDPQMNRVWDEVHERWAPPVPQGAPAADDADQLVSEELRGFIARLAADGLWLHEALATEPLKPQVRRRLLEEITRLGTSR